MQMKFNENAAEGPKWILGQFSEYVFTVIRLDPKNLSPRVVILQDHTCSCGEFQENTFPCVHAAFIIRQSRKHPP